MNTRIVIVAALASFAAGCTDDTESSVQLSSEQRALVGCWRGYSGDEHVEYRFDKNGHSLVLKNLGRNTSFTGEYAVDGTALTLDFGEEPPTYSISVTPTELTLLDLGFVYTRTDC